MSDDKQKPYDPVSKEALDLIIRKEGRVAHYSNELYAMAREIVERRMKELEATFSHQELTLSAMREGELLAQQASDAQIIISQGERIKQLEAQLLAERTKYSERPWADSQRAMDRAIARQNELDAQEARRLKWREWMEKCGQKCAKNPSILDGLSFESVQLAQEHLKLGLFTAGEPGPLDPQDTLKHVSGDSYARIKPTIAQAQQAMLNDHITAKAAGVAKEGSYQWREERWERDLSPVVRWREAAPVKVGFDMAKVKQKDYVIDEQGNWHLIRMAIDPDACTCTPPSVGRCSMCGGWGTGCTG